MGRHPERSQKALSREVRSHEKAGAVELRKETQRGFGSTSRESRGRGS